MSDKTPLVAIPRVHYGRDAVANPGETFSVDSDTAARLVKSKAASAALKPPAPEALPKSGLRKTKAAKPKAPVAEVEPVPEADAGETLD